MKKYASKVILIATSQLGYLEKRSNYQLDDKTANAGSNNYTKFARDLDEIPGFYNGKKNGHPWCDVFVDWCFVQAFGVDGAKELLNQPSKSYGAGCSYSARYYKNKGQFYKRDPMPGDQIFFSNYAHTGLVVDVDNEFVYTIEGNTSGASGVVANGGGVCRKKYELTFVKIDGYGRPDYDPEDDVTNIIPPVQNEQEVHKPLTVVAREVIDGVWGSGNARKQKLEAAGYDYNQVQAKVNELLKTEVSDDDVYTLEHFIKDVQSLTGASIDGEAGPETLSKTVTLSIVTNRKHVLVRAVQRRLTALGYDVGDIDGIFGAKTRAAVILFQKDNGCTRDGVITARNKTWRKLLGMA